MIRRSVHMVDANGVGSEFLHESGVKLALSGIDEGIVFDQLIGNTWNIPGTLASNKEKRDSIPDRPLIKN